MPTDRPVTPDLTAVADALERLAGDASWTAHFTLHGDPFVVPVDRPYPTSQIAAVSTAPDDYGRHNAHLLAASPSLARSLAAVLRAVADDHAVSGFESDSCMLCGFTGGAPCDSVRAVLAAVEPLLPLLGVELERIEPDRTTAGGRTDA